MSQTISLWNAVYSNVPAVDLPKQGGGTARFTDVTPTTATDSDVAQGKIYFKADGSQSTGTASGGGGGELPLLATLSMGTISTSSTSATDTGKSISVSGINAYDALIVDTSVNTVTNNRHLCTIAYIWLTASSTVTTKNGGTIATAKLNMKISSSAVTTTRANATAYGIYPNSISISNGTATIPMYQRYNSTQTGTINGTYTARVYGLKLYDLIGG